MEYYERIRALREDNDISQKELSRMLKISQQSLSKYETNKRKLPIELLKEYAKIFNVSTDYIMGLTDNPEPNRATVNKQVTISGKKNKVGDITIK